MTSFRPFRNGDVPALADLWNRGTPDVGVAKPLEVAEFKASVIDRPFFDADGLIVASRQGQVVGFAHSGFGPVNPDGPSRDLDASLGAVLMLVVDPEAGDEGIGEGLIERAARSLRERGAAVIYAGGQSPLNPFYWGVYGGSEFSGILVGHGSFQRAAVALGFREASRSVLLEIDLDRIAESPVDPRTVRLRREARPQITEDATLPSWWESLGIGGSHPVTFRLATADGSPLARATTWDMAGFERLDGRLRVGIVDVEVDSKQRRRGFGRYLIGEVIRYHRARAVSALCVQTIESNETALKLYRSMGFEQVGDATLYRLDPGAFPPSPDR